MKKLPVYKKSRRIAQRVYAKVSTIPQGKVTTYKVIAMSVQVHPRQIGYILHKNPDPKLIPCHRVVNFKGQVSDNFAFGGPTKQKQMLASEGVIFTNDKVDLKNCLWKMNY